MYVIYVQYVGSPVKLIHYDSFTGEVAKTLITGMSM